MCIGSLCAKSEVKLFWLPFSQRAKVVVSEELLISITEMITLPL